MSSDEQGGKPKERTPLTQSAVQVPSATRSRMMKAVKQKNTGPEVAMRRVLREMGIHYRLNNNDLPGSPDMANRQRHWGIFVNGCFWHGHRNCEKTKSGRGSRIPAANQRFWQEKLACNRKRDAKKCLQLRKLGFKVVIVWECELFDVLALKERLSHIVQLRGINGSA